MGGETGRGCDGWTGDARGANTGPTMLGHLSTPALAGAWPTYGSCCCTEDGMSGALLAPTHRRID